MKNTSVSLLLLLIMVAGTTGAGHARETEPDLQLHDTGTSIEGNMSFGQELVAFSATYARQDFVAISFRLNGKEIAFNIEDGVSKSLQVQGLIERTGDLARMAANDTQAFERLLYSLQLFTDRLVTLARPENKRALDLLVRSTELMAAFGKGRAMDTYIFVGARKWWTSLCSNIGQWRTAYWTNSNQTRHQNFVVGGHGVCKGRCGPGCPWFGDPSYSQDCLNHDACAGEEGQQFGVCWDEWDAAADDYIFAPDCT